MELGKKLKKLRTDQGYSMEDMKNRLNKKYDLKISKSMISRWENGVSEPVNTYLAAYAKEFNLDLNELLGIDLHQEPDGYITIKVYGEVPAGIPIEAIENIEDSEDLSLKDYSPSKQYIGLKVSGDSMYPDYLEGDNVIVEVTSEFYSGQDCVVYVNGYNATLKKVIKNDDNTITLKPINPVYPPRTYGENDDPIKILGVVREIRRKK